MKEIIAVGLGERSYQIHVGSGLVETAGTLLKPFARGIVPVVSDTNVAKLHRDKFCAVLRAAGIDVREITLLRQQRD